MIILLYVLNYAPKSVGIGKLSCQLASWLAGRGHNVRVITDPPYFPTLVVSKSYRKPYSSVLGPNLSTQRCH